MRKHINIIHPDIVKPVRTPSTMEKVGQGQAKVFLYNNFTLIVIKTIKTLF